MKRSTNFMLVALWALPILTHAQSPQFQYGYDAAGNRTERNMIVLHVGQPGGNQAARSGDEQWPEEQAQAGLQRDDLRLYPNPTEGQVHLEFAEAEVPIKQVRIVDQSGRLLYRAENLRGQQIFDFSGYSHGLYFIILQRNGEVERFKVVKK